MNTHYTKYILLSLITLFLLTACSPAQKGKSVSELITEIHDLDSDSSIAYNSHNTDFQKFVTQVQYTTTLQSIKTLESYGNRSLESGKKASDAFAALLTKINEVKGNKKLSETQAKYLEKLELASKHYDDVVKTDVEYVNNQLKLSIYLTHEELFFEHFNNIIASDALIPTLDLSQNYDAALEELDKMESEAQLAAKEASIMKSKIQFENVKYYEEFPMLIQEYVDNLRPIFEKKLDGEQVYPSELNAAEAPGLKAGKMFKPDQNGVFWAPGEEDELEAYRAEHIYPLQDKIDDSLNKASVYYDDAKLLYEKLTREELIANS